MDVSPATQYSEWFRINKMQANPDKFQFLAVGRKTYDKNPSIHIQNFNLTCESTVKLLIIIQGAIRNKVKYVINKDIK
jgi:glycosyltransferase involved in cell wall biosynthesis